MLFVWLAPISFLIAAVLIECSPYAPAGMMIAVLSLFVFFSLAIVFGGVALFRISKGQEDEKYRSRTEHVVIAAVGFLLICIDVLPYSLHARYMAGLNACIGKTFYMDSKKEEWAMEEKLEDGVLVDTNAIMAYVRGRNMLICPLSPKTVYDLGRLGEETRCPLHGSHSEASNFLRATEKTPLRQCGLKYKYPFRGFVLLVLLLYWRWRTLNFLQQPVMLWSTVVPLTVQLLLTELLHFWAILASHFGVVGLSLPCRFYLASLFAIPLAVAVNVLQLRHIQENPLPEVFKRGLAVVVAIHIACLLFSLLA